MLTNYEGIINYQNPDGNTSLMIAAMRGHLDVVDMLLEEKEIDVNLQNNLEDTPLMVAIFKGDDEVVDRLLDEKEIDINLQNNDGVTAFMIAVIKGNVGIVNRLINQLFLPESLNINLQDIGGNTAYMGAIEIGAQSSVADQDRYIEIVKILLHDPELDMDLKNDDGVSALDFLITKYVWVLRDQDRFDLLRHGSGRALDESEEREERERKNFLIFSLNFFNAFWSIVGFKETILRIWIPLAASFRHAYWYG